MNAEAQRKERKIKMAQRADQARADGIADTWMEAARRSPVYKMAVQWKVALPLHPEYRTLPMVWYVPPLSPISVAATAGHVGTNGEIPDVSQLRIPVKYLANLLTAGYEDRFVISSTHREYAENTFDIRGGCGFSFGNGCSDGTGKVSLFGGTKKRTIPIKAKV